MDDLTIGKMAKINNVSEQTLRLYDKIGLLKPQYINEDTNYRYYSIKQSARLDMIQYMKSLGMNLKQIKEQLDKQNMEIIQNVLKMQKCNLERKIKELTQAKNAIDRTIMNYQKYNSSPKDAMIVIEYIPQRKIYCYESGINFYDYGIETYEYMLRELKKHILLHQLPMVYFCNVGTILRKEKLDKGEFVSTEIFLFVDDSFESSQGIEILPANTYLCIYCDSFYKEKEYAKRLLENAKKNGYKIIGDYICEVVVELPIFVEDERNMFIKLQLPIRF